MIKDDPCLHMAIPSATETGNYAANMGFEASRPNNLTRVEVQLLTAPLSCYHGFENYILGVGDKFPTG
jgi:hypothetical protein